MPTSYFPPPAVPTVGELVALAHQQTAEGLEQLFGRAVLVGAPAQAVAAEEEDPWAFNTVSIGGLADAADDPMDSFRESLVFGVRKAKAGAFADTILIGRASSNDICVADSSLSKLHARIHVDREGGMVLTDSGSKNGTRVNGKVLAAKASAAIHHGDEVQLGSRAFRVYATSRLYTVLRNLVPRRQA